MAAKRRTISVPASPGSRQLRGMGRLRSLLRRSVSQVDDMEQSAIKPSIVESKVVEDDLNWILSDKSYLNIGAFIVDKQEHVSGLGSSCDVLTAWSSKHDMKVAVKRIRAFLLEDKKFAKRLAREIRIWASLKHDNVLPLLGYFLEGDRRLPNLVSEWMVNGSLFVYMKTFPRCGFVTCKMLRGIASGLAHLHSQEVVHADLKTQNVLISSDGRPLLSDFGLSLTLTESQTVTTTSARGSVRWMAPELFQFEGGESSRQNKATDIWAFGMVAYLKVPFFDKRGDHLVMLAIIEGMLPVQVDAEGSSVVFRWIWDCCLACWRNFCVTRPSAMQLERLWSLATKLEAFEDALESKDSDFSFDDYEKWVFDMQTAFLSIGVVAKLGLTTLLDANEYESLFTFSNSGPELTLQSNSDYRSKRGTASNPEMSSSQKGSPSYWRGSPMSVVGLPPIAHDVTSSSSLHGSPMSVDRQSFRGPVQGSPMAIDHIISAPAKPQSLSDSLMSF